MYVLGLIGAFLLGGMAGMILTCCIIAGAAKEDKSNGNEI